MTQEVEHRFVINDPVQGHADGFEEMLQLPSAGAESRDVADRAHGNLHESPRINKRLSHLLGRDNAFQNLSVQLFSRRSQGMSWIQAADPVEAEVLQHPLHIRPISKAIFESPRSSKTGRVNSDAGL